MGPSDAPNSGTGELQSSPYPSAAVAGAAVATTVMPVTSLIASSALLSSEQDPSRRAQLRMWRRISIGWLVGGLVIAIVLGLSVISAISSSSPGSSGACRGGVDELSPPSYSSYDGINWIKHQDCVNGGSISRPLPASEVPGGGK